MKLNQYFTNKQYSQMQQLLKTSTCNPQKYNQTHNYRIFSQYWYCNYNINCTDNFTVQPAGFGTSTNNIFLNLKTLTQKANYVWKDNICIYKLVLPKAASNNDTLSFRVNVIDRGSVYTNACTYSSTAMNSAGITFKDTAVKGQRYLAYYPNNIYLMLLATEIAYYCRRLEYYKTSSMLLGMFFTFAHDFFPNTISQQF